MLVITEEDMICQKMQILMEVEILEISILNMPKSLINHFLDQIIRNYSFL